MYIVCIHVCAYSGKVIISGGRSIQEECTSYVRGGKKPSLEAGEIYCSGAGSLHFRNIIHVVSAKWDIGEEIATGKLSEAVDNALQEADVCGLSSLAIPTIGAGAYNVPVAISARTIVKSIKNFLDSMGVSTVRTLYLCDTSSVATSEFVKALRNTCSNTNDLLWVCQAEKESKEVPVLVKTNDRGSNPSALLFMPQP